MSSPTQKSRGSRFRARPKPSSDSMRKSRLRRMSLEGLEARTLLSVLPPATRNPNVPVPISLPVSNGSNGSNSSTPSIAVDPTNPLRLAAAWTVYNPGKLEFSAGPPVESVIEGATSVDGGQTWQSFNVPLNNIDPTTSNPSYPYLQATDATVTFDRSQHFYVLSSQHNDADSSGSFILNKYNFTGNVATPAISNKLINQWIGEPESAPSMAVDQSVGISGNFVDPLNQPIGIAFNPTDGNLYVSSFKTSQIIEYSGTTGAFIKIFVPTATAGLSGPKGLAFHNGNLFVVSSGSNQVLEFSGTTGAPVGSGVFVDAGQGLNNPDDLVFQGGNLYVTSTGSNQVLEFNGTTGATIGTFVAAGSGGLSAPDGLAFDASGNLYVVSAGTKQVLQYNSGGTFVKVFATGLTAPDDLVVGPDNNIYVSDNVPDPNTPGKILGVVDRFSGTTGALIDNFVKAGSGGLSLAQGMAFNAGGDIFVASENTNQILHYTATSGAFLGVFDNVGTDPLKQPVGAVFGPDGNLYVSSFTGNDILRYSGATGNFKDVFVPAGSGGLTGPKQIVFQGGNLYVVSSGNNKVIEYNGTTGALIGTFASGGGLSNPDDLVFSPIDNNLYVTSTGSNQVLEYDGTTGAFIKVFVTAGSGGLSAPKGLVFQGGNLFVASSGTNQVLSYNGTTGAFNNVLVNSGGAANLLSPDELLFDGSGNLYVTTGETQARVLEFTGPASGNPPPGTFLNTIVAAGSGGLSTAQAFFFQGTKLFVVSQSSNQVLTYDTSLLPSTFLGPFNKVRVDPLNQPIGAVFGPDGNLYVSNFADNQILRYNGTTGAFIDFFVPTAANGGLSGPKGVAFSGGNLFVASSGTNQILEYNGTTGAFIGAFVAAGSGGLSNPDNLVFQGGNLFVSSTGSNQILEYNGTTGAFITAFVAAGSGTLSAPKGLVFNGGNLFVVSSGNNKVIEYNGATGALIGTFVTAGSGGLSNADELAFGPDGNLYVTTGNAQGRVLQYNGTTGAFLRTFVAAGSGGLNNAQGLIFSGTNLYVVSSGNNQILRYNATTLESFDGVFNNVGSDIDPLQKPVGVIFGPDGNMYVASAATNQILRYSGTTGQFLDAFVVAGSGGLTSPQQIAFSPIDGNLYVVSAGTNQVLEYDGTTGEFIKVFASNPNLQNPYGLAFQGGNLYVTSTTNREVVRFDGTTGAFINVFVTTGSGGLTNPQGLTFDSSGNLYVASSGANGQILKYDSSGTFIAPFATGITLPEGLVFRGGNLFVTTGQAPGPPVTPGQVLEFDGGTGALITAFVPAGANGGLSNAQGLVFNGDLYVASENTNQILRYGAGTGTFVSVFNNARVIADPLNAPVGLTFHNGSLFVASRDGNQIDQYDGLTGLFQKVFANPSAPHFLTFGPDGNLYVSNFNNSQIDRYNGITGAFIDTFVTSGSAGLSGPQGLVFQGGNLYVVSSGNNEVLRYDGTTGAPIGTGVFVTSGLGGLANPVGLTFDAIGNLYVTSSGTNQVLEYNSSGGFAKVFTSPGSGLSNPQDLAFHNNSLFVTSQGNNSVFQFDATTGLFQSVFVPNGAGGLFGPAGLTFDAAGNLFVSSLFTNQILEYNGINGSFIGVFDTSSLGSPPSGGFTDPSTGLIQSDPFGTSTQFQPNIYIVWAGQDTFPATSVPGNFNPNRIRLISSSDGGNTFGPAELVDTTGEFPGAARYVTPRVVVSQGRAPGTNGPNDPGVTGGLVSVVWDDIGTGANGAPPFDQIDENSFTPGESLGFFQTYNGNAGAVQDAIANPNGPHTPRTTAFPITVAVDQRFTTLSDLNAFVAFTGNLSDIEIQLQAPNGLTVTLLRNNTDASGTSTTGVGLTSTDLGVSLGNPVGTIFDDQAIRSLQSQTSASPYIGNYTTDRPPGGLQLNIFNGWDKSRVNGIWKLLITDFRGESPPNPENLVKWGLQISSGLTANPTQRTVVNHDLIRGVVTGAFPTATAANSFGIGPDASIASDNTLGSFSPHEGRLYITYVDRYNPQQFPGNPADNTDIFLAFSDDGGATWQQNLDPFFNLPVAVNDDSGIHDGFSEGTTLGDLSSGLVGRMSGRPQFDPSVAVDPQTGTLVISYLDTRYDAARARVATMVATSIDGGLTFGTQTFANRPNQANDEITQQNVTLGPIPDNASSGNPKVDVFYGLGSRQGLAVAFGHVYPAWSGNENGGDVSGNNEQLLTIHVGNMEIATGPRVISSTMGPIDPEVNQGLTFNGLPLYVNKVNPFTNNGFVFNGQTTADGTALLNGFIVTFDRPMDPASFTPADVQVWYRDTVTPLSQPSTPVAVSWVVPLDNGKFGPTSFLIAFTTPQSGVGTYSYWVGPNISDRIRSEQGNLLITGNLMDQNANGIAGQDPQTTGNAPGDVYAVPRPLNGSSFNPLNPTFFPPPYDPNTLPLIIPGPHVIGTQVINDTGVLVAPTLDNLVTDNTVSALDVTFDRDMDGTTFTASDVLRIMGPTGLIYDATTLPLTPGAVSVALSPRNADPNHPRIFRISFPKQQLSGTYTVTLGPDIFTKPASPGAITYALDTNLNAGIDVLRGSSPNAQQVPVTFNSAPGLNLSIPAGTTKTAAINVTNIFPIQALTLALNMLDTNDSGLKATLVAPDGTQIVLFSGLAGANLTGTVFDDSASTGIASGTAPYTGSFKPQNPLNVLQGRILPGQYQLKIQNTGTTAATLSNWGLTFSPTATVTVKAQSPQVPLAITANSTIDSTLQVGDTFPIQGITLKLNINFPHDPQLTATLIAPDGTRIQLFSGVGTTGNQQNFSDTVFDDAAGNLIQNGGPPFFGSFKPQEPLGVLQGKSSAGTYTLEIKNASTTDTGTLNSWSLTFLKAVPSTGLGEPVADQKTASFRIFTMDPTNPLSSSTWTAVGPAAIFNDQTGAQQGLAGQSAPTGSGVVGALAVDPSDPSGNTVYVAGASGGIWKTTDFLTTSPTGPTYVPLTDFGPTFGLNIGSIAVFGRNNDPNQSIVIAATGNGDTNTPGLGFIRSEDGGATWALLDSTTNVDKSGNLLPLTTAAADGTTRDHLFVGTTSFKIIADPKPTKTGDAIFYAALSGQNGGIWRSIDTGNHWTLLRAGNADDIVFDPASGFVNAFSNPTGNLQILYGAFRAGGSEPGGVYISQNQGLGWSQLLGGVGDPLFQDITKLPPTPIPVSNPPSSPTGGGRIVLVKPDLVPSSDPNSTLKNILYEGWLYAAVITPNSVGGGPGGNLQGVYMTKDFGQNWTKIQLPNQFSGVNQVVPSNNTSLTNYDVTGGMGNYDVSLAIDPTNPNVVYLGGTIYGNPAGMLRIDTTGISDPYSFYMGQNNNDGGAIRPLTNDPFTLTTPTQGPSAPFTIITAGGQASVLDPRTAPQIDMIHDPNSPFANGATFYTNNGARFANSGANIHWIPFDDALDGSTNHHRVISIRDPLTGHARLIWGDDQGVFTGVDNGDGTLVESLGSVDGTLNLSTTAGDVLVPNGSRNGNLQITQFYYGAAQPSNIAAQAATIKGMFFGGSNENDIPHSDPNVVQPGQAGYGNLQWTVPLPNGAFFSADAAVGNAAGVALDQTDPRPLNTVGDAFNYRFPNSGGNFTDFFQVNDTGRTFGLVQNNPGGGVPDQEWPLGNPAGRDKTTRGVVNFAVNPIDGDQAVISSTTGQIFRTENRGQFWLPIASPGTLDSSQSLAMAYGAPDPNAPGGGTVLDNFIYVGTEGGHVFVTFTGGGAAGNQWTNISAGLDGSPVRQIVTNPTRTSHEAFAVTTNNVYWMPDSSAPNATWQKITGDLFTTMATVHSIFGNSILPENEPHGPGSTLLTQLNTVQADWRYVIPDNPSDPASPTHPMLYIGAETGVYRSVDKGQSWTFFPDSTLTSQLTTAAQQQLQTAGAANGALPVVNVTDLSLSLGFIDPTTGRPNVSTGSNVLLASTFGRGDYAIRLAPIVFPNTAQNPSFLRLDPSTDSGVAVIPSTFSDGITNNTQPIFDGLSEQSAFGNTVTINVIDLTNPANPVPIPTVAGTAQTDGFGHFQVQVAPGYFKSDGSTDGLKVIGFQAVDASGTKGNIATINFTLDTTPPVPPGTPKLDPVLPAPNGSDTGLSQTDNITNASSPVLDVLASGPNATPTVLQLLRDGVVVAFTQIPAGPVTTATPITDPGPITGADVVHVYTSVQEDVAGNTSTAGTSLSVTFDTVPPPNPGVPALDPNDDSGVKGDGQTNVTKPHLVGTLTFEASDPAPTTQLVEIVDATNINNVLGTAFVQANGTYSVQFNNALTNGGHAVRIRVEDQAGNFSASPSPTLTLLINNIPPQPAPSIALSPSDDTGAKGDNITSIRQPHLIGVTGSGLFVDLIDVNGNASNPAAPGKILATVTADSQGNYSIQFPSPLADGTYVVRTQGRDVAGNTNLSPTLTLTIDATPPANAPTLSLLPADDSGVVGDGVTNVRRPHLVGTTEPGGTVSIIDTATGDILATSVADQTGHFTSQLANNLNNGTIQLVARETDVAGNVGPTSTPFTMQIITVTGDYDGDGKGDLSVFRPTTGTWYIKQSTLGGKSQQFGLGTDIPLQGDFDGDGKTDLVLFRPSSATWFVLRSSAGPMSFQFGAPNLDIPVTGDFNGDGKSDFAVFRPTTDDWFVALSGGGSMHVQFGQPGVDRPEPADYNGDGKTDIAVYRPTTGQWFIQGVGKVTLGGQTGDIAVPGVYDGGGKAEAAIFRPSTDQWLINSPGGVRTVTLGQGNDIAVPGDYNGDGKTELATFKSGTGTWLIQGGGAAAGFGAPNLDIPVPRAQDYISITSNFVAKSAAGGGGLAGTAGGNSFGGGGSGGGMRTASFNFGQQAASLSAGSRSAGLVVVPNPATTTTSTAGSSSSTSTSRASSSSSSLLATSVAQPPPVTVVTSTSDQPAKLVSSSDDNDTTLSAALAGIGRVKAGRLLPDFRR